MLRLSASLIFFLLLYSGKTQTTVYLFPGQGSDERIFEEIAFDSTFYQRVVLTYPVPKRKESMKSYAQEIAKQIDTSGKYVFIGVSLGGMLCSELLELNYRPEKTIVISSAKCRDELPFRYRFQKYVPLNRIIPKRLIKCGALILQPLVEPDRKSHKESFKAMLKSKSPRYYKRTVNLIIHWDKQDINPNIIHIHGTSDHTLPYRKLKPDFTIVDGSHMMTLTCSNQIEKLLNQILRH